MSRAQLSLVTPMSPAFFEPFDGIEGVCAFARDEQLRLIWHNEEFPRRSGLSPEELDGSLPRDISPPRLAYERVGQMRFVLQSRTVVSFYEVWHGARWHTRIWPLDPGAFECEGCFILMTPAPVFVPPSSPAAKRDNPPRPGVLTAGVDLGDLAPLSKRELEILYYLASGMTVAETAATLFRSPKTVSRHAERIHQKLGYRSRADLVTDAVRRGVVAFSPEDWMAMVDLA